MTQSVLELMHYKHDIWSFLKLSILMEEVLIGQ